MEIGRDRRRRGAGRAYIESNDKPGLLKASSHLDPKASPLKRKF